MKMMKRLETCMLKFTSFSFRVLVYLEYISLTVLSLVQVCLHRLSSRSVFHSRRTGKIKRGFDPVVFPPVSPNFFRIRYKRRHFFFLADLPQKSKQILTNDRFKLIVWKSYQLFCDCLLWNLMLFWKALVKHSSADRWRNSGDGCPAEYRGQCLNSLVLLCWSGK